MHIRQVVKPAFSVHFKMANTSRSGHLLSCMAAPRQAKALQSQSLDRPVLRLGGMEQRQPKTPRQITVPAWAGQEKGPVASSVSSVTAVPHCQSPRT